MNIDTLLMEIFVFLLFLLFTINKCDIYVKRIKINVICMSCLVVACWMCIIEKERKSDCMIRRLVQFVNLIAIKKH